MCIRDRCSGDQKIKIFDFRAKRLIQHYDAHTDAVVKLSFHPSGNFLLSASNDSKLKIWDLRKGTLAYTLYGHNGNSSACTFSPFGDYFASGGSDTVVLLWQSNFALSGKENLNVDQLSGLQKTSSIGSKSRKFKSTKEYKLKQQQEKGSEQKQKTLTFQQTQQQPQSQAQLQYCLLYTSPSPRDQA
eukprot:TRINITY_DN7632_c0_g1_i3.p1 TRINITY_DN7632_c0_g1~~TRINITY_DN7632_c0_g1_i3.p1  ORF type:complete len:187 (-),score=30.44 TRINITY_DN7632_c0_g1_i3:93-653(-)